VGNKEILNIKNLGVVHNLGKTDWFLSVLTEYRLCFLLEIIMKNYITNHKCSLQEKKIT